MKFVDCKDLNGNIWKLKTEKNEKYPSKSVLWLYINKEKHKIMSFTTPREADMFWRIFKTGFKGEIHEEKEVTSE